MIAKLLYDSIYTIVVRLSGLADASVSIRSFSPQMEHKLFILELNRLGVMERNCLLKLMAKAVPWKLLTTINSDWQTS